jgi:hypothetical protein
VSVGLAMGLARVVAAAAAVALRLSAVALRAFAYGLVGLSDVNLANAAFAAPLLEA